jgi:hypothetical protein
LFINAKSAVNQDDLSELAFLIIAVVHSVIMKANQSEVDIPILKGQKKAEMSLMALKFLVQSMISNQLDIHLEPIQRLISQIHKHFVSFIIF